MPGKAKAAFDPRVPLLLLLSVTTGLVDATSVLGLGKVFTANMTGNVVFLGFAAAGAPGFRTAPFLVAIGSFLLGALIGGSIARANVAREPRRWLMTAAAFETAALWTAAAVALRFDVASQTPEGHMFAIVALTGTAMGFRNATVRQMKVTDLTTTVLTLTLTGLGADWTGESGVNSNWLRRIAAVLAIFIGAAIGAFLLAYAGMAAPLVLAGILVLAGTTACIMHMPRLATS